MKQINFMFFLKSDHRHDYELNGSHVARAQTA